MPILEFPVRHLRNRVAFVRNAPPRDAVEALKARGYECYLLTEQSLKSSGVLEATEAMVLEQNPSKPSSLIHDLQTFAPILDHDCRLFILAKDDPDSRERLLDVINRQELPTFGLGAEARGRLSRDWYDPELRDFGPCVHILSESDRGSLGEFVARNPAGRAPNLG